MDCRLGSNVVVIECFAFSELRLCCACAMGVLIFRDVFVCACMGVVGGENTPTMTIKKGNRFGRCNY